MKRFRRYDKVPFLVCVIQYILGQTSFADNCMIATVDTDNLKEIRVDVNSSIIEYLEYSKPHATLSIKFKSGKYRGRVRLYDGIPPQMFFELLSEPSVGKAVIRMLKDRRAA